MQYFPSNFFSEQIHPIAERLFDKIKVQQTEQENKEVLEDIRDGIELEYDDKLRRQNKEH